MARILTAIFDAFLAGCPRSFRQAYGPSMRAHFASDCAERRAVDRMPYALRAYSDLLATIFAERTADLRRDLVSAWRSIAAAPGFVFVVIGTIALAIGANVAVFAVVRAVVLAPLPYERADRIVALDGLKDGLTFGLSLPDFRDLQRASTTLASTAAIVSYPESHVVDGTREPHAIAIATVTPKYFDVFAMAPYLGRYFAEPDARPGGPAAIVLGEHVWRTIFDGRSIVGSTIRLEGTPYRVIGIAPARFSQSDVLETHFDAWRVLSENDSSRAYTRDAHYFDAVGRLRDGSTVATTTHDLERVFGSLRARYPAMDTHYGIRAVGLLDETVGEIRTTLFVIVAAVGGVLAIACSNVASLMLGRASARERDVTIRLALGASRGRIAAAVLTETFAFVAVGGALGIALAGLAVAWFAAAQPSFVPRVADVRIEGWTLAFGAAVVALTTLAAGVVPAWTISAKSPLAILQTAGRSGDASRGARGRAALVVFEIACALALVVVAGLVVRGYAAKLARPLGFDPRGVVVTGYIQTSGARYDAAARRNAFFERSVASVRQIPGVANAAWTFDGPFVGTQWNQTFDVVGREAPAGQTPDSLMNPIGDGFFRVLGMSLLRGRAVGDGDRADGRKVVDVNSAFVRRYLAEREPLGTRLMLGGPRRDATVATIVGVVADARRSYGSDDRPTIYLPFAQNPPFIAVLVAKTVGRAQVEPAIASAIAASDTRIPRLVVESFDAKMASAASRDRLTMDVLIALATISLVLALAGIFAVVSFGVSQRTHEFGVRMALGAQRSTIRRDVLVRAMRLAAPGIALGLVFAAATSRALGVALGDVPPLDAATFASVVAIVVVSALAAALVPACRATRVDPVVALRSD